MRLSGNKIKQSELDDGAMATAFKAMNFLIFQKIKIRLNEMPRCETENLLPLKDVIKLFCLAEDQH